MPLESKLMRGDPALEACLVKDTAHLTKGAVGDHVAKIHTALFAIDDVSVAPAELRAKSYGPSTASAVLRYKSRRNIINTNYQKTADDIVGKMTIARMDKDMKDVENRPPLPGDRRRNLAST